MKKIIFVILDFFNIPFRRVKTVLDKLPHSLPREAFDRDGFLCRQSVLKTAYFGVKPLSYNGCGIMALYNVLHAFGNDLPIGRLIERCRKSALLGGRLGLSPRQIMRMAKDGFFTLLPRHGKPSDALPACDALIHLYLRRHGTAHYVAGIADDNGRFRFYNADGADTKPRTWESYRAEMKTANGNDRVIFEVVFPIRRASSGSPSAPGDTQTAR